MTKLAKAGHSSAAIGALLRDRHGIVSVKKATGKSVAQLMREAGVYPELPEDLFALLTRAVNLRDHLKKHKKDRHSMRGLELIESRIRRLAKYYVRKGTLPKGWRYEPAKAKLLVQKA